MFAETLGVMVATWKAVVVDELSKVSANFLTCGVVMITACDSASPLSIFGFLLQDAEETSTRVAMSVIMTADLKLNFIFSSN